MIVEPKIRGFICTTAHPEGCAKNVQEQIAYVTGKGAQSGGPKRVLIIGASTGYGLATRIAAAFGYGADTLGVFFERPASGKRTASAGWYNSAAFEQAAHEKGVYAKSINGDAFSNEIKEETLETIRRDWGGGVDLVIYSVASPRRTRPQTGETFNSVLKPVGPQYTSKDLDVMTGKISDITIDSASKEEIEATTQVMGGEDWHLWIEALTKADLLAPGCQTLAYSYIGPEMTHAIYRNGTIGHAKADLEATAHHLSSEMQATCDGRAMIAVNKALVTQASSAIPVVPLYTSALYRVMKEKGIHEGCIEQMWRLFTERLCTGKETPLDSEGRIRLDDWEMRDDVQQEVVKLCQATTEANVLEITDLKGYRDEFNRLFGFGLDGIDYTVDVEVDIAVPSMASQV